MSTVVAPASAAPMPSLDRDNSPKTYSARVSHPAASSERVTRVEHRRTPSNSASPKDKTDNRTHTQISPADGKSDGRAEGKRSPKAGREHPKIIVKKESPASSPSMSARHRPRKLDLSSKGAVPPGLSSKPSAGPMTARDGLIMQDVGIACLSPGFQTQDPTLREQLQRSLSVREHQRSIIEARMLKSSKGDGPDGVKPSEANMFGNGPPTSSKKRPPPGLTIVPPSAEQFANERVIQSAPLNQTFTGRHQPNPMTRHMANQPSNLSKTSHIHHAPAIQTSNRLPPLSEFLNSDMAASRQAQYPQNMSNSSHRPPLPSPGLPPHTAHALPSNRPRDFRSAEEAVHEMTGGRDDLRPKIVHYTGHHPPTPPSPPNGGYKHMHPIDHQSGAGRRRSRVEYEEDHSPPLGTGREKVPLGPFGSGRESPQSQRRKKDEFLNMVSRAWDLWHN